MTAQASKAISKESVWDYPPDGGLEPTNRRIRVVLGSVTIADTTRAIRALEKGIPPDYYIPLEDVKMNHLDRTERTTFCEFKGTASYLTSRWVIGSSRRPPGPMATRLKVRSRLRATSRSTPTPWTPAMSTTSR